MSGLHDKMGARAFQLLKPGEQKFWKDAEAELAHCCDYPDLHLGSQWEAPEKEPFYARYCVMANGRVAPHGPQDKDWRGATFGDVPDPEKLHYALRYYMEKVVHFIAKQDVTESVRFAGSGAHVIQDCSNPGHVFNNLLLNRLFPANGKKLVFMHRIMDSWPIDLAAVKAPPELLGRTVDEAAYLLGEKILANMDKITADMIPLCQGIIAGHDRKVSRIMQKWNARAIHLTASFWHTAFVIASNRIPSWCHDRFNEISLVKHPVITAYDERFDRLKYIAAGIPFYKNLYPEGDPPRANMSTNPYPFEASVNCAYDANGDPLPLVLRDGETELTGNGFAAGAYSVISFTVPGDIYGELEVTAGIHPASVNNCEAVFAIWCCDSDVQLLASGKTTRDGGVIRFKTALPPECRTLSLLTAGGDGKSSSVWLNPVLKSKL
ncbi:MAG: hypothetical protein IJY46_04180 [Lentisphaeria bacterium]|nr:hypothetical protein [Lentisphaeria bacterium]